MPRSLLSVRWSPDGTYLAAVPLYDARVMLWHTADGDLRSLTKLMMLRHTRVVHQIDWRSSPAGTEPAPVLVVMLANCQACIYAPVVDEPYVLRQWAAVDAAVDQAMDTGAKVVALMYCDAYRLETAVRHDKLQLEQLQQWDHSGVASPAEQETHRSRSHQLEQLMAHSPDLFFALLSDGSLAVYALLNLQSGSPTLLNTYVVLHLAPTMAMEEDAVPLLLRFVPLAFHGARKGGGMIPTAVIHAQSANGMRGIAAISLALLFDGDARGFFVQDTLLPSADDVAGESDTAMLPLLRAEHKADIVALDVSHDYQSVMSLSNDGVLIGWHMRGGPKEGLVSQHRVRVRGASYACVVGHDAHFAAVVGDQLTLVAAAPQESVQGQLVHTADSPVETHRLPSGVHADDVLVFNSVCTSATAFALVLLTRQGKALVWPTHSDAQGMYTLDAPERTDLASLTAMGTLTAATLVESMHWGDTTCHALCTCDDMGHLDVWALEGAAWTRRLRLSTSHTATRVISGSKAGYLALAELRDAAWHVSVWDLSLAHSAYACVHEVEAGGTGTMCLAWGKWEHEGVLAMGAGTTVTVVAKQTPRAPPVLGPVPAVWGPVAAYSMGQAGTAAVDQVQWVKGLHLLIASTCQLFLFTPNVEQAHESAPEPLTALLAEHAASLPLYHPRVLQYAVQLRLHHGVHAVLTDLARAMTSSLYDPDTVATLSVTADDFGQRSDPGPVAQLYTDELLANLTDLLQSKRAPGLRLDETHGLLDVLQALQATLAELVDEPGRQCLIQLYPLAPADEEKALGPFAAPTLPPGALLFWAQQSQEQEILAGRVQSALDGITWPRLRASGIFAWSHDRARLVPLMEQAARAAYTAGDEVDPVLSTMFYLALKQHSMVRSVWRRAVGHQDYGKMATFLANDFSQERWRLAAQKNAFALISQRRFGFAAAFFLLSGSLQDAVNVCIRNLKDIGLAIALARVYEDDEHGPVFLKIVRSHIVPLAVQLGDRWMGCWALHVLGEHTSMLHMITVRSQDSPRCRWMRLPRMKNTQGTRSGCVEENPGPMSRTPFCCWPWSGPRHNPGFTRRRGNGRQPTKQRCSHWPRHGGNRWVRLRHSPRLRHDWARCRSLLVLHAPGCGPGAAGGSAREKAGVDCRAGARAAFRPGRRRI